MVLLSPLLVPKVFGAADFAQKRMRICHTVWCPKMALIGLRDGSRLFHEHFADVFTSRLGFTRSDATSTLFVEHVRNVFIRRARG